VQQSGATATLVFGTNATSGTLSVVSVGECNSNASTLEIIVQGLPSAPGMLSGPLVLCAGTEATYGLSPIVGESYSWTLPSGWTGDLVGDSITVVVAAPGGTLSVSATNTCGSGATTGIAITVTELPQVSLQEFQILCLSAPPVALSGGMPAGGTYTFNGVPITSFSPLVGAGSYPIVYTVVDSAGCSASASQDLEVDACAGISERTAVDMHIHPNPVSGGILNVHVGQAGTLRLYDATGRSVAQLWHGNPAVVSSIPTDGLSPGAYLVVFETISGVQGNARVIVAH
jgi:hypothetical protein